MQSIRYMRRSFIAAVVLGAVCCLTGVGVGQVVIGNFENGSLDGWQPAPGQTDNPMLSSVPGSSTTPPSNTLGDSVLKVTVNSGGFWGPISENLLSTPNLRNAFINATSISYDLTIIGSELSGTDTFNGFAQSNEMTINSNVNGTFSQHAFDATAGDSDSLGLNAQWNGMDGTRTLTYNLANFTVTDPTTKVKETYQQYVAAHPELTDLRFWFVTQFGNGNAAPTGNFYFDNVVLNGVSNIPEPASLSILGFGLSSLAIRRHRRNA